DLQRLFVEFQQLGSRAERSGGTGLGLALTKRIVEAQGGTVGATSVLGHGTTFFATLPRDARPRRAGASEPAARAPAPTTAEGRIAIVDDDPASIRLLTGLLAASGFAVDAYADGDQYLAGISVPPAAVVVLDVSMPRMRGTVLVDRLRERAATRDLP